MQTLKDIMRIPTLNITTDEVSELLDSPSLQYLADYLPPEESVHDVTMGVHNDEIGTLAITDRRVIFVNEAPARAKLIDVYFEDILAAISVQKLFMSTILIKHSEGTLVVGKVTRKHAKRLADKIDTAATKVRTQFIERAV